MRVATWNLERKKPTSPRGAEAIDYLRSLDVEVIVVTEARTSFMDGEGYVRVSDPPLGTRFAEDERKVVVWSASPLEDVAIDSSIDPRRFVAVRTATSIGPLIVLGVCIPWHMAEVTYHSGPKKKPWEEHIEYLDHLKPILGQLGEPFVTAGDFNQRVPRPKGANRRVAEQLAATFADTEIVSSGVPSGCERQGIDHIAVSRELTATNVQGWPNDVSGNRLSDHDGVLADVEWAPSSAP